MKKNEKTIAAVPCIGLDVILQDNGIEKIVFRQSSPSDSFVCRIFSNNSSKELQEAVFAYLDCYARKETNYPPLPISLSTYTPFERKVYHELTLLKMGSVISYEEMAMRIGKPKAFRAVGNACGKNNFPLVIPCHRVRRKNGQMGGFAGSIEVKKALLEFETPA